MNPYPDAIAWNNAEGGTNGQTVTTGNSGGASGSAWTGTQMSGTGTSALQFTSTLVVHDTRSYRIVGDGSGYSQLRWHSSVVGTRTQIAGVVYVRFDDISGASGSMTFHTAHSDDGDGTIIYRLRVTNAGVLQLTNGSGTTIASTSGTAMASGVVYRIEWQINHDTNAYTLQVYRRDETATIASVSGFAGAGQLGIATAQVRFGVLTQVAWAATFDTLAISTSKLGARVTSGNLPPVVSAGDDQTVTSYETVTLTATSSDPDGDTLTTTWTQTSGTPTVVLSGTGSSRTFSAPVRRAGTTLTFTATVSDGTDEASDDVIVTVAPHNEWAVVGGTQVAIRVLPVKN